MRKKGNQKKNYATPTGGKQEEQKDKEQGKKGNKRHSRREAFCRIGLEKERKKAKQPFKYLTSITQIGYNNSNGKGATSEKRGCLCLFSFTFT